LKLTGSTFCKGYNVPSELKAGIAADYFWLVDIKTDTSSSWVAESGPCNLAGTSKRPYIGRTKFNTALFPIPTQNDDLVNEKNIICAMHELAHNMGFSDGLFQYYLDANGKTRKGHVTKIAQDGWMTKVLNAEPLTSMVREHFGCSTIRGAYMENTGPDGTYGSHFERRHFGVEMMTTGLMHGLKISKFTLALFETTGWFYPDYSYADAFPWGQGQGCDFLTKSCTATDFSFEEFCTSNNDECSTTGEAGGPCKVDVRSNDCKFVHPSSQAHCQRDEAHSSARLPSIQVYGRKANSKCFTGTLGTSKEGSSTAFCFKTTCSGSGSSTVLKVNVGSSSVTCTKAGPMKVSGYAGTITCPDPIAFCKTSNETRCPRGCMGRGTCGSEGCVCKAGYKGIDCAVNA